MKKLLSIALAGLVAATLLPGASLAQKGKAPTQTESGTLLLPAPYTDDTGCYAGLHRRFVIATGEAVNEGPIGYNFEVDPKTWNKKFVLTPTGGQGTVDMDIYFYSDFGTVDDVTGDPLNAGSPYTVSFNTRNTDGEFGKVPPDMNKVIVCMLAGGANATFEYTAGKGVKFPKS